jgi:hypothetical protein
MESNEWWSQEDQSAVSEVAEKWVMMRNDGYDVTVWAMTAKKTGSP